MLPPMSKTSYTLIMPGLFASAEQVQQAVAPRLKKWLRGTRSHNTELSYVDFLLSCFNYPQGIYDLAGLRAEEDGLDANSIWLCADPLHLAVDVTHVYAVGNAYLDLTTAEVDAYVSAINAHLPVGLELVAPHPLRWYLKLERRWDITCAHPHEIFAKTIRDKMPQGVDGVFARALFNEIQMLLHSHAGNRVRQQAGQPTLDALWLWGVGAALPLPRMNQFDCVQSNDPLALALARRQRIPVADLAEHVSGNVLRVDTRFQFHDSIDVAYRYIPEHLLPFLKSVYVANGVVYEKTTWYQRLCKR